MDSAATTNSAIDAPGPTSASSANSSRQDPLLDDARTAESSNITIVIKAGQTERLYWSDLWRYRELLLLLAYRDISVHYKQTLFGVAWALIRPLSTMLVFVFVFSKIARLPSDEIPYPLLVLAGMLPWQLFASALAESSNSLVVNTNLVSKVYFPRLIVPLSALAVSLVDFLICLPVLLIMMFVYQVTPSWRLVFLPLFVGLALASASALGLWLSALNVRYRDVRYIIPFIVQFGMYLSPVGYSSSIVPADWRWLYGLNPMAAAIDGVRWSLFGPPAQPPFTESSYGLALLLVVVLLIGGIWYFRRTERTFADVI